MSEQSYLYRGTNIRQAMGASPQTADLIVKFCERPLNEPPRFYTGAERNLNLATRSDQEALRRAQRATERMGRVALTLASPVRVARYHNPEDGGMVRIHFAVKEPERLRQVTAAFDHIADIDRPPEDASLLDIVYTDLAIGLLARDPERLLRAKSALLRDVNNQQLQSRPRITNPIVVERHITMTPSELTP